MLNTRNRWGPCAVVRPARFVGSPNNDGYIQVTLTKDGVSKVIHAHTLVAEAFIGPRPSGMNILHEDGNQSNNHVYNLRYGTQKQNHADARAHGTWVHGEKVGNAKLTEKDVLEIRNRLSSQSDRDIANFIRRRKTWKHLSEYVEAIGVKR
jgi:hypothetical protein